MKPTNHIHIGSFPRYQVQISTVDFINAGLTLEEIVDTIQNTRNPYGAGVCGDKIFLHRCGMAFNYRIDIVCDHDEFFLAVDTIETVVEVSLQNALARKRLDEKVKSNE